MIPKESPITARSMYDAMKAEHGPVDCVESVLDCMSHPDVTTAELQDMWERMMGIVARYESIGGAKADALVAIVEAMNDEM